MGVESGLLSKLETLIQLIIVYTSLLDLGWLGPFWGHMGRWKILGSCDGFPGGYTIYGNQYYT